MFVGLFAVVPLFPRTAKLVPEDPVGWLSSCQWTDTFPKSASKRPETDDQTAVLKQDSTCCWN